MFLKSLGRLPRRELYMSIKKMIKGIALVVLGFLAVGAIGILILLGLLSREHRTPIALPALTGHFPVGRSSYELVNPLERDELAPSSEEKRRVIVWMWYPAAKSESGANAEYLPPAW